MRTDCQCRGLWGAILVCLLLLAGLPDAASRVEHARHKRRERTVRAAHASQKASHDHTRRQTNVWTNPGAADRARISTLLQELDAEAKSADAGSANQTQAWKSPVHVMSGCPQRVPALYSPNTIRQRVRLIWADDGRCKGIGKVDAGTCLRRGRVVRCLPSFIVFGTGKGGTAELQSW